MTEEDALAADVFARWRQGEDSHAIADALDMEEFEVLAIVHTERADRRARSGRTGIQALLGADWSHRYARGRS